MQKTKHEYDQSTPPPVSSDRAPLIIVCEQTGQQRVQMKMDELFHSSPRIPAFDEPTKYENSDTLQLKKLTTNAKQSSRKRRLSTNSAAGRNRRMEEEQTSQQNKPASKLGLFSAHTLKLAMVAVLASFFRA